MRLKKVIKIKNGIETSEMKECTPRELPLSSRFIETYWFDAIKSVNHYEKQRGLVGRHLLIADNRIEAGLKLYRDKHIDNITITTENCGDFIADVTSEKDEQKYIVVIKNYLTSTGLSPQFQYQREKFISELQVSCTCSDYTFGRYKDNASLCCKHICAAIWFLQERFNMPRIFITPEQKIVGYQKSDVEELATNLRAMPLLKFTPYINVLLMKKYRDMPPAISISAHREDNETHKDFSKEVWLTYTYEQLNAVEGLIKGIIKGYKSVLHHKGISEKEIAERIDKLIQRPEVIKKKKRWWVFHDR
jgi:hypothetical protein